jgi:hypothetical protein
MTLAVSVIKHFCFDTDKMGRLSLAKSPPNGWGSTGVGSGFTRKNYITAGKKLETEKRSSLFCPSVSDEEKEVL